MKCIPLQWPDEDHPRPTFVIHKKEAEVLADIPNKNPRSQYLGASFSRRRLYVCDAHRFICLVDAEATGPLEVDAPAYVPFALIKTALGMKKPSLKMTTALLVSKRPHGTTGVEYQVAALETENKAWALYEGDVLLDKGELVYQAFAQATEVALTVPRVEMMDEQLRTLTEFAKSDLPTARTIRFQPEYLATFGKLAQLTKPNIADMHIGAGSLDAALFHVTAGDDSLWWYVLMPMK